MPIYTTKIHLQDADEKDYSILNEELNQQSFDPGFAPPGITSNLSPQEVKHVNFIRQGNIIQEVIDDVLRAARKTGKKFSFTIIKNKN